jgi:hypothetical protein
VCTEHTLRLSPGLAGKLADYAAHKRVPQALVVEMALASHLSPDGADRLEAAVAQRKASRRHVVGALNFKPTCSSHSIVGPS